MSITMDIRKMLTFATKTSCKLTPIPVDVSMPEDRYTEADMRNRYGAFRAYYMSQVPARERLDLRMPNMPEDISENIVKFILRHRLNTKSQWARHVTKPGDLWCAMEGVQECKCFMSDGPLSFGPDKTWDAIYFLDLRKWLDDELILHRCTLTPRDEQWKNIRMSGARSKKKEGGETWSDCVGRGARPHIGWDLLYPQIREHCTEVYRGPFEGIFSKDANLAAISSTTGTETALPASA